jgi:hypothetical protein
MNKSKIYPATYFSIERNQSTEGRAFFLLCVCGCDACLMYLCLEEIFIYLYTMTKERSEPPPPAAAAAVLRGNERGPACLPACLPAWYVRVV